MSLQFREKDVVGDSVKGLTEVQTDWTFLDETWHHWPALTKRNSVPTSKAQQSLASCPVFHNGLLSAFASYFCSR